MSDDDFYDDDFHSNGPSPRSAHGSPRGGNSLMPIVEVPTPSESGTLADSTRSDDIDTHRTNDSEHISEDESDNEEEELRSTSKTPTSGRKRTTHRSKVKNGRSHIDMTPPDKHLKRAERKSKRYIEKKKNDNAVRELIRCTALARIVYGDGHWKLARSYVTLADGYFDLKGTNYAAQAQYHADFAKSIMMGGVQMSESSTDKPLIMEVLVNIYYTLGRANTVLKKFQEAEQSLSKAEKLTRERAKLSNVKTSNVEDWKIKIYLATAKLSARQQKFAMATTYFEKALDNLENKYGQDSEKLIPVYQALGKVEQGKGDHADHERAIEHFLQAHSIASAKYKGNSAATAETARALATAYSNIGDDDAEVSAESYLNECLGIYQAVHGPHHKDTVDTEDELARLMIRTDRQDEGVDLLRSGIEAKKEVYGDLSPEVAETWKLVGNVFLAKGDTGKALAALKKCHNIESTVYGMNNKKSKDTQRTIDLLMANPNLASKQKKTKADELKERPRFSSVVSRSKVVGGTKVPDY